MPSIVTRLFLVSTDYINNRSSNQLTLSLSPLSLALSLSPHIYIHTNHKAKERCICISRGVLIMDKLKISVPAAFLLLLHVLSCISHAAAFNISTIPFTQGFTPLFGEPNIIRSDDDHSVQLHLNQYTGM